MRGSSELVKHGVPAMWGSFGLVKHGVPATRCSFDLVKHGVPATRGSCECGLAQTLRRPSVRADVEKCQNLLI